MARLARLVVPGLPHHVTQRGNRRQQTFFCEEDYAAYVELMADWCKERGVEIWGYCLMPNHVHLIAVPRSEEGLARAVGEAHRRYTRRINFREKWRGYLWQGRFASFVMDEPYLLAAARYVELNPVRAGLAPMPAIGGGAVQERICQVATTDWCAWLRCWRWLPIGGNCWTVRFGKKSCAIFENTFAPAVRWEAPRLSIGWNEW